MERMVYVQRNKDFGDWETIIMSTPLLFANPTTGPHPELVYELRQRPLNINVCGLYFQDPPERILSTVYFNGVSTKLQNICSHIICVHTIKKA